MSGVTVAKPEYSFPSRTSKCASASASASGRLKEAPRNAKESRQSRRKSVNSTLSGVNANKENSTNRQHNSHASKRGKSKPKYRDSGARKDEDDPHHPRKQISSRRSASRDRITPRDRRTKSTERKSSRTKLSKKKATIRRTRSYESITMKPKRGETNQSTIIEHEGNRSYSGFAALADERGFPLTSEGCAPMASLTRTCSSPNNVETDNFDAIFARKLHQEECARARSRRRPRLDNKQSRSLQNLSSRSLEDCKNPAAAQQPLVDDDRKPSAKRRSRSTKRTCTSRRSTSTAVHSSVPLNPEETIQRHRKNFNTEAKTFVQRLKSLVGHRFDAGSSHQRMPSDPKFTMVLTDDELKDLVLGMFQTQSAFQDSGKPHNLDVGYHFCRANNVKRIQQQPGLWSKIQARGVNRSQDGDGIYTFNNPLSSQGNVSTGSNQDNVWMIVARLQGNRSSASPASRRQWSGGTDAFVNPENGVVVLKTSTQFFPLLQFRSTLIEELATSGRSRGQRDNSIQQIQLMQERLQLLLDDFFNSCEPPCGDEKTSPSHTQSDIGKRPQPTGASRKPPQRSDQQLLPFSERVKAVSNPAAWQIASEVQAAVEEHACAARAMMMDLGMHAFAVQSVVAAEEMAVLADNLFQTQKRFLDAKKPAYVEIGYHYCRGQNLKKMQQKPGFWSNLQSRGFNKSEDGDGIYTFNDPLGARSRGNRGGFFDTRLSTSKDDDVWLLVARLQGNRQNSVLSRADSAAVGRQWSESSDALLVGGRQSDDVVVLKTSAQFFPVLQFSASSMDATFGGHQDETKQELQMAHQRLQGILDQFFNNRLPRSESDGNIAELLTVEEEVLDYCAPNTLDMTKSIHSSRQQIYKVLSHNKKATKDDCSICLDSLRGTSHQQVVRLNNCGHEFHRACLHEALHHFDLCPICNQGLTPPSPQSCLQGLSPSGIMVATTESHTFCRGCWAPGGSLVLSFFIPAGLQKVYHENPGAGYSSSDWKAYLPYNEQGVRLLRRLQYAYCRGLLFTISGGKTEWASVPLKTCPRSSELTGENIDAFPDAAYFDRCNQELDRCGVPEFIACQQFVSRELEAASATNQQSAATPATTPEIALSLQDNRKCLQVLKGLQRHQHGWMFCTVLPMLDGKVENPMDFNMIEQKLAHHDYSSVGDFSQDVSLTFDNAMVCHSKANPVHYMAKQLKKRFKKDMKQLQT